MRRTYLYLFGTLAALGAAGVFVWQTTATTAAPKAVVARSGDGEAKVSLPLTHVILFNSGVGYFQREGVVDGDVRIDMTFRVGDVNDLLKSLVLQDLDGGRISAISYDSQEPVEKTLKSFALDLTYNPTIGQLLNQARGEKVEVTLQQAAAGQPAVVTGVIMGMEAKQLPHKTAALTVETDLLNLLCAEGVRTVKLTEIQRLRFLNAGLDAELRRALEVLASSHDSQKKVVSLNFKGQGRRRVRVGYVVENPMWKASYRLVLKKEQEKKNSPLLQGWALIENTSDEDWKDVKVALISGRPISFQMDLYQPLFIPRPTVEPERFASLRPPTYNAALGNTTNLVAGMGGNVGLGGGVAGFGGLQGGNYGLQGGNAVTNPFVNRYQMNFAMNANWGQLGGQFGQQGQAGGLAGQQQINPMDNMLQQNRLTYDQLRQRRQQRLQQAKAIGGSVALLDPAGGVSSVASAEEIGDYFQYTIDEKITLPRQKSAMLPIVNKDVEARRFSIYNEKVHAKFPLLGLKFKNLTGQNLIQGPVTVYEGGAYAGDARLMDMQPDEQRLLSYAIDLGSEVKTSDKMAPEQLIAVKVNKGIIQSSHKLRDTKTYTLTNRSKHDRTVIVEHPIRTEWKLVEPAKANEQSRDVYRFEVKVAAGKTVQHKVTEEQTRQTRLALSSADDRVVKIFLTSQVVSPKVKTSIEKAVALRNKQAATKRELLHVEKQLKAITDDQTRLRANIDRLPPTSAAYKRYLKKFDDQETQIEKFQATIQEKQEEEKKQLQEYEDYLSTLTVE
jgi:hypothetical protein